MIIMKLIEENFNKTFAHWKIVLSEKDLNDRNSGYIQKAGWLIQYCFGEDQIGEYMDYYAAHRMTNDRHVRIYADGSKESLPALHSMHLTSEDPVEAKRLKDEFYQHNREVGQMLVKKGFDKFTLNMYLCLDKHE